MFIKYIKLENVRSYINQTIDFSSGKLLLSGDIGSGKSTILLAIEFALFGINKSDLPGYLILKNGKNSCSVELCFELDNNNYIIKRALKRNKDTIIQDIGYIITNGKKFEGTATELKAKIIEILGYPEELINKSKTNIFRYTVYCPQEEMKKILYENSEDRLDTLRRLFNIDKYKTIRENADLYAKELRKKISEIEIRLENYTEIEKTIKEQKNKIKLLEKNFKTEIDKLNELKKTLEIEKTKYQEKENKIKLMNEIKREITINENLIKTKNKILENISIKKKSINEKIEIIEKKLLDYSDIKEQKQETEFELELNILIENFNQKKSMLIELEQKLKNYNENKKKIEQELEKLNSEIKKIELLEIEIKDIKEKINLKKEQENLLEKTNEKINNLKIQIEKLNLKINDSKTIIDNLKDKEVCPLCLQVVDENHKKEVIEKENEKINKNENELKKYIEAKEKLSENTLIIKKNLEKINSLEKILKEKSETLAILKEKIDKITEKKKELFRINKEISDIDIRLKELDLNDLIKEIDNKKKNLFEIRKYNLRFVEKKNLLFNEKNEKENYEKLMIEENDIKNELLEIKKKNKELENNFLQYKDSELEYLEQKKIYDDFKEKEKHLEIEIHSISKEKTILINQLKEYEKKLEAFEILKKKAEELKNFEQFISEFFIKLMITMEKHIMVSIHREFQSLLKEWFSMMVEGIDIELEDDFSVKIIQDGYETTIFNLSGGEKTAVALSYRLALNKVINDIISNIKTKNLIILDEPTDGFSSEQLDKLRDVLEQLNMKQTIIVSHEQKMESYVDKIIRINKINNVSKPTYL
ncbi:MAG: SMC family ATPase [Candidatus Woesearchaeota archaeon]